MGRRAAACVGVDVFIFLQLIHIHWSAFKKLVVVVVIVVVIVTKHTIPSIQMGHPYKPRSHTTVKPAHLVRIN